MQYNRLFIIDLTNTCILKAFISSAFMYKQAVTFLCLGLTFFLKELSWLYFTMIMEGREGNGHFLSLEEHMGPCMKKKTHQNQVLWDPASSRRSLWFKSPRKGIFLVVYPLLKKKEWKTMESSSDLQIESWYFPNTPTLRARKVRNRYRYNQL